VDPASIVLTASTSEAYASLFKLLADDGDRVLVPRPSYPLFDHLATLEDVVVDGYPLHHDGHWWIDLEALQGAVTPRTRAVMVVSPNNPTGSFVKEREWNGIQEIAARHGLAVGVDEVFSDYALGDDPSRLASAASRPCPALTFVLSGLSKVLGLPQVKLGWMVVQGPPDAVREATARLEILLDAYLSVSTPAQVAARELLPSWRELQEPILDRVREGLHLVAQTLAGGSIRWLPPEGGWCVVLRLPATRGEEDWILALLREDHVLVHPGYFFDISMEPAAVISLLTPPGILRQGLSRIASRVAREP
jgi:aspartate/methionine/tyrosine aminotransferase